MKTSRLFTVITVLLICISPSIAQTFCFDQSTDTAGMNPRSAVSGDLNNDGDMDVVFVNNGNNNVEVYLGNGDGTFQTGVTYACGTAPNGVAIGDLNGDMIPDLAVANRNSNDVSILLGTGGGVFAAAVNYASNTGPGGVTIGLLNADGIPDLAVANRNSNDVSVLLGTGGGVFAAPVNYATGTVSRYACIADLNNDGTNDLAVVNQSTGNVSILMGSGGGAFVAAVNYPAGTGAIAIDVFDLDNNNIKDIVTANVNSNDMTVLMGTGGGTFAAPVSYPVGTAPQSISITDMNGDGIRDAVISNSTSNDVSILLGNGNGTFQAAMNFPVFNGGGCNRVGINDFDGDGNKDFAVSNGGSNNMTIMLNTTANIAASGPTAFCFGDSVTLTGNASGTGFLWNPGSIPSPNITVTTAGTYYLTVSNQAATCSSMDSVVITTFSCAGVEENTSIQMNMYPNPADNYFNIQMNDNILIRTIQIGDLTGKVISSINDVNTDLYRVSVTNLTTGIYMVTVFTDHGNRTQKLIIR